MSNKDLLKQAIAEAKTIREAAIANAKEALEESLTPHLKEMLALKLQEMEEEEDDMVDETINQTEADSDYSHGNLEEAKEEEEEEEEDETEEAEEEEEEPAKEDETEEEEELEIEEMSVEDLKDLIRDIVAQEIGGQSEEAPESAEGANDMVAMGDEEEIDINEILAELAADDLDEYGDEHNTIDYNGDGKVDAEDTRLAKEGRKPKMEGMKKPKMEGNMQDSDDSMKEELEEALATVAQLRGQLQEVNLLNAKLLYVNKVFKANNLTEGQKVNVVAAFDKAETVKEVKLVYETVSKNVSTQQPKQAIKEHKAFASKPAGTTQKQVINEVSEAVKRMQILAGIREREI